MPKGIHVPPFPKEKKPRLSQRGRSPGVTTGPEASAFPKESKPRHSQWRGSPRTPKGPEAAVCRKEQTAWFSQTGGSPVVRQWCRGRKVYKGVPARRSEKSGVLGLPGRAEELALARGRKTRCSQKGLSPCVSEAAAQASSFPEGAIAPHLPIGMRPWRYQRGGGPSHLEGVDRKPGCSQIGGSPGVLEWREPRPYQNDSSLGVPNWREPRWSHTGRTPSNPEGERRGLCSLGNTTTSAHL